MSTKRDSLLIVGGGIGGLTAALALARKSIPVRVLERAPAFETVGAGIQFGPNATRILDALGVLDTLLPLAVLPRELVYMDALSGLRISSLDLGESFLARYGHPYIVVHRGDVQKALLDACAASGLVSLETGRDVKRLEDHETYTRVSCADNTEYEADALVIADGVGSVLRRHVSEDEPRSEGFVAYRGTIPIDQVSEDAGRDSMLMWVAPGIHMVQYKVSGGEVYNQVAAFQSRRFLEGHKDWGTPEELDEQYGQLCEEARHGASLLDRSTRYPMRDRDPLTTFKRNRIVLLGDAAHPMLPVLAQGGCQAIEDGAALARCVENASGLSEALTEFDSERVVRAGYVQAQARRFADVCHIGGVGVELRNAVFSRHQPLDYEPFDWMYAA